MEYIIHLIILINIYVILTTSTNLLVGLTIFFPWDRQHYTE